MATIPVPSTSWFLGLELATDQLRAVIVDPGLNVVGSDVVDFDTELQFGTHGGIFSTPGDAYTTPVDMWVKALDVLMNKLSDRFDMSRIKAIGGSAQSATVWLTQESKRTFANLRPSEPLYQQMNPSTFFSLLHIPVSQDTSTLPQTATIAQALPNLPVPVHPSLIAVQCMKIREGNPDAFQRTARVLTASSFLCSLLAGKWVAMSEAEALATGMWKPSGGGWDSSVLEIVAGGIEQGRRFAELLGGGAEVFGGRNIGPIANYFVERYRFDKDAFLVPFTSDRLASYLSVAPASDEVVLSFGNQDTLMIPSTRYAPHSAYTLHPHPAQEPSESRRYVAMITHRNAEAARTMVRDTYTKSWSAFDRLVSVIPPGGSIGLDDKLFSFWILHNEQLPTLPSSSTTPTIRKGIYRVETGHRVNEFRDLRANPRCLLESQLMSFRVAYARVIATTPLFGHSNAGKTKKKIPVSLSAYRNGAAFDPYDKDLAPRKVIALGNAANFPSMVAMMGDMFFSQVFVPTAFGGSFAAGASMGGGLSPHLSASSPSPRPSSPSPGMMSGLQSANSNSAAPSRPNAAIGAAYVARWAWRRQAKPEDKDRFGCFEDEIRSLLQRKWANDQRTLHESRLLPPQSTSPALGYPQPKRSGSGLITPDGVEDLHMLVPSLTPPPGLVGLGMGNLSMGMRAGGITRARTPTQSSNSTVLSQLSIQTMTSPSTAQTSPGGRAVTPTSGTAHHHSTVCVSPLASTTDEEFQAGLCKVAEPDWDGFMTYASIVPEFCRVEGMLARGF